MELNYIDEFLSLLDPLKHRKKVKLYKTINNQKYIKFNYNRKEDRKETDNIIQWDLIFEEDFQSIIYDKIKKSYYIESTENDYLNIVFLDEEWLEKNNAQFDGNICLEPNYYQMETTMPKFILMFILGMDYDDISKIDWEIQKKKRKINLINNNFVELFFKNCHKVGENLFTFKLEHSEKNIDHVTFQYDSHKNKNIDNDIVCWDIVVIYEDDILDKRLGEKIKKEIRSSRNITLDLISEEYSADTDVHRYLSSLDFTFEYWRKKKNVTFNPDEFFILYNRQLLKDRVFRLQSKEPRFALMVLLGANWDEMIKMDF